MATKVIDALIVTLGLDATNYKKGSAEAVKQLGNTRSAVVKSSNEMGKAISGAARSFALAFVGFSSASGFVRMLAGLNEASRQLGILSRATGQGVQDLKNYGNVFAVMGGSVEAFNETMLAIQKAQFGGINFGITGWEKYAGILNLKNPTKVGDDGRLTERDQIEVLGELAEAFKNFAAVRGEAEANSMGLEMGFSQDAMNVMIQGKKKMDEVAEGQKKLIQNAAELAEGAKKINEQWELMKTKIDAVKNALLGGVQPATEKFLNRINDWLDEKKIVDTVSNVKDTFRLLFDPASFGTPAGERTSAYDWWSKVFKDIAAYKPSDKPFISDSFLEGITGTWQSNKAKYKGAIGDAERKHGIPSGLLEQIAGRESSWNSDVISGKRKSTAGAVGLMQLMPSSFPEKIVGKNPLEDIETGAAYLREMFEQFGDWEQATAAYNAGPGTFNAVKAGRGGLPSETANYVNALFGAGAAQRVAAPVGTGTVLAPSAGGSGLSTTIGTLNIYPAAGTGEGVRLEAARAIERRGLVNQSDYGVRP